MTNIPITNSSELWELLREEINHYHQENGIEYLDYKKRAAYNYESERQDFENEFYHFPCEEVEAQEIIQVFHTFYETDIWGIHGPVKLGDERLELSLKQIASNVAIDKPKYIYDKLGEKYSYIEEDIQRALIGPRRHLQLLEDHPEERILVNLHNIYAEILSSNESQLKIFENINLNKTVADTYTEILDASIQNRIKILAPRMKHYRKKTKIKFQTEEIELSKDIPLIKLNYSPDQQSQIIQLLYDNLIPDFLETSYHQFERHFILRRSRIVKLVWKGKEVEIAHLFRSMRIKNIIIIENQNKLIELHFLNNKDESFKNIQLSVSLSKTQIENFPKILYIIDELKKLVLTFN